MVSNILLINLIILVVVVETTDNSLPGRLVKVTVTLLTTEKLLPVTRDRLA
jgi:hypothetical protein